MKTAWMAFAVVGVGILLALPRARACAVHHQTFGAPITKGEAISLAQAVNQFSAGKKGEVLIEGKLAKVCEKKGCWAILKDGDTEVRMTFKDYGFFIPKDSAGQKVLAFGEISEAEESVSDQKHYLKDAKAPQAEIDKVTAPRRTKKFVASGVKCL